MHVKARQMAFGGLLLALTVVCMVLGSVIETNTLFLLAAASYFVGIVIHETSTGGGAAFYLAGILLGFMVAPNKLYVASYAAMGLYIVAIEWAWHLLGKTTGKWNKKRLLWVLKYVVFNAMFIPTVICFPSILVAKELPLQLTVAVIAVGQIGLFIYDKAYEYVLGHMWGKIRVRLNL